MFDTYGKYMDLMMCVEIISHKFDLETHVSRLDLLVIRFGQRTNLKLMRKKSLKARQVLQLYIGCDVRETLVMLRMRQFIFLRPK